MRGVDLGPSASTRQEGPSECVLCWKGMDIDGPYMRYRGFSCRYALYLLVSLRGSPSMMALSN